MPFGLTVDQMTMITKILAKHAELTEVIIFGSRAMNTFKHTSDIDLALKGNITFDLVARIKAELEEDIPVPYFFDIVDYHAIHNPDFKAHIDRHGKLFYKSKAV